MGRHHANRHHQASKGARVRVAELETDALWDRWAEFAMWAAFMPMPQWSAASGAAGLGGAQ